MFRTILWAAVFGVVAAPVSAQSSTRFYTGGMAAVDSGNPGSMNLQNIPAAGGMVGLRLTRGLSFEVHVDRGFKESTPHPRIGHFGIDTLYDRAAGGSAVLFVWKSRPMGRVTIAGSAGFSRRFFRSERRIGVDRPVSLPPDDPLLQDQKGTTQAAGPTVGVLVPISLGGKWSIAPELRLAIAFTSEGIYGDGAYGQAYSGVRVMWGF